MEKRTEIWGEYGYAFQFQRVYICVSAWLNRLVDPLAGTIFGALFVVYGMQQHRMLSVCVHVKRTLGNVAYQTIHEDFSGVPRIWLRWVCGAMRAVNIIDNYS